MSTSVHPRVLRPVTPAGLLAERLRRLRARADELPGDLAEALREAHDLAVGLEPYIGHCTSPASPALADLAARTCARDWADRPHGTVALEAEMLSGHVEGAVLRFLVALSGARHVLEVGMFTGYSALAMAEVLPDDGHLIACELDPDVAAFAEEQFASTPAGRHIEVRVGPAADTLAALAEEHHRFGFVFIDADKAGYLEYLMTILDGDLLAPGGMIAVDNTLLQGEPYLPAEPSPNGRAIAQFNAAVAGDPRIEQVLLGVRDGLTLIRRVG